MKTTIIVPIYKAERYIERCVRSIMNQNYKDIEIILVNDGSPDNSADIINYLANLDSRIIVVNQSNRGVSAARNAGLKQATGEWITFVDSDDWIEPDYVSNLLKTVNRHNCDMAMGRFFWSVNNNESADNDYRIKSVDAQKMIYNGEIFVAVWNKLFKTEIIRNNGVLFNEDIWYGEGMLFNIQYLQYVDYVAITEKSIYHQTFNPNSAMRAFNLKSNYCGIKSMNLQKSLLTDKDVIKEWEYHKYKFNRSIIDGLIRSNQLSENIVDYKRCIYNLRKNIWIPLKTERRIKQKLIWILYFICPRQISKIAAKRFRTKMIKSISGAT